MGHLTADAWCMPRKINFTSINVSKTLNSSILVPVGMKINQKTVVAKLICASMLEMCFQSSC